MIASFPDFDTTESRTPPVRTYMTLSQGSPCEKMTAACAHDVPAGIALTEDVFFPPILHDGFRESR